ncbi:hypothetical protein TGAM01_v201926 [Trichoderma gamsii]|uniref:Methyltransferase domain-containing protein n=1 Tax=Trichoderma gamsii TaxID=398673 RepID=A0A2P4ZX11_9HYPO|nr:hypothetical protein TGAM01_v201926 [Trichoderma gamsii]PON28818.1 hypothetical protein TGAM01_v201926 [Trichoderma gamsii]
MTDHTLIESKTLDYYEELPDNKERIFNLLQSYSKIPVDKIEDHLRDIRDRAWKVFPYGCIGRWLFLDCVITSSPEYPRILKRLEAGEVLLDAGCAFGYVLRQLAADGSPASNLIGTDLQQGFIDLGYELFKDRDSFSARFIAGDLLKPEDPNLDSIDGKVDIIHAAALFHLFDWDDQVTLGSRLVKFFKPDANAMLVGRQVGTLYPTKRGTQKDQDISGWYRHNLETWQQLWDEIGDKTGTQWRVRGTLQEMQSRTTGNDLGRASLNFVIAKV